MNIQEQISLADYNWFCTGGQAAYFCEPGSPDDFTKSIRFANENEQEIFLLGEGANILVSDRGFPGLVIHPVNTQIAILQVDEQSKKARIRAGAGVVMQDLIDFCLKHEFTGLEEFSGIPSTIGGAVYINLHYFEYLLSDFFVNGRVISRETGEIQEEGPDWFRFGYDQSSLHTQDYYLVDAVFEVEKSTAVESAYATGRRDEIIRHRNRRYPESNTCGSFFRNFHPDEVELTVGGQKMIYVAYYLDNLGVKGKLSHGDAAVSSKHANMIVTRDGAQSADVINLAKKMQELVRENYGITPQPECQLIGFSEYPLYK